MSNQQSFLYEVTEASIDEGPPHIEQYRIERVRQGQIFVTGLSAGAGRSCFQQGEIGGRVFTNIDQALTFALNEICQMQLKVRALTSELAKAQWSYTEELATVRAGELQQFHETFRAAQSILGAEQYSVR